MVEAEEYEKALKALPATILPYNSDGFPVFDLLLIGVGALGVPQYEPILMNY